MTYLTQTMITYMLIAYDGELLFHNSRKMRVIARFKDCKTELDVVTLLCQGSVLEEVLHQLYGIEPEEYVLALNQAITDPSTLLTRITNSAANIHALMLVDESEKMVQMLLKAGQIVDT